MQTPKVSVIVPVYNVEPYLRRCLDSILAQTFTDFEAILVDDGSTDGSGAICDEYAAMDNRFMVVHQENKGVAKARLTAFEHSRGELITFIDADDYVSDNYIKHLYDGICKNGVDVSCCQVVNVQNSRQKIDTRPTLGYFDKKGIDRILSESFLYHHGRRLAGMHLYLCGKMIRRCYVREILEGGAGLWYGEDMVGVFVLMQRISSIYLSEEALYFYNHHDGQATMAFGRRRWKANVMLWEKLLALDQHHYLRNQMPYRIKMFWEAYMTMMFNNGLSFSSFKDEWHYVFSFPVIQNFFVGYAFNIQSVAGRIQMWTMQHDRPFLFYVFMTIRKLLYR